ncbi:hypothetical protein Y1Q_0011192 [Alligator mississippiensis]|uniref:Ubiquitin-like protease family profile domain-containing protein n=1 Tax=Alligator mississippiensis TaxID=8496 RepID=A0A151MRT6_ALLMI|nr:hypothetical protein Y1Q_0011192 [Alligator mississippiensis]
MSQSLFRSIGSKKTVKRRCPDLTIHMSMSVEDPEEAQAKRRRIDQGAWHLGEAVDGVAAQGEHPSQLPGSDGQTSVSDGAPRAESADETLSATADLLPESLSGSAPELEMLQLEKRIPRETSVCRNQKTAVTSCPAVPCLGDICSELGPEELPGWEPGVSKAIASEAKGMSWPCSTAEEGAEGQERGEYKPPLEFLKEQSSRNHPTTIAASQDNTQACSRKPFGDDSHGDKRKPIAVVHTFPIWRTGSGGPETESLLASGGKDASRGQRIRRTLDEPGSTVQKTSRGRHAETDVLEEGLIWSCLASASAGRPPALEVEEQIRPSSDKTVKYFPQRTEDVPREEREKYRLSLVFLQQKHARNQSTATAGNHCNTQASSRELLKASGHGEGPICGVGVPPFVTRRIGSRGPETETLLGPGGKGASRDRSPLRPSPERGMTAGQTHRGGIPRAEREKYMLPLIFLKRKHARNQSDAISGNHFNTQALSREPFRAGSHGEGPGEGAGVPPLATLRTGSRGPEAEVGSGGKRARREWSPCRSAAGPGMTAGQTNRGGFPREEKEKYKLPLIFLKRKHARNQSTAIAGNHCNPQACSKELLSTGDCREEHHRGVGLFPFVPRRAGDYACIPEAGSRSPETEIPLRSGGKGASSTSPEPGMTVGQTARGRSAEIDVLAEVSAGSGLAPAASCRPSALEVEEEKCLILEMKGEHLPQLSEDMERKIMKALGHGHQDEILSSAFNLKITRQDMQTLRNRHWLNDEVINFYMNLLVERNKKKGFPALHAFSTFFYPQLTSGGYQGVHWGLAVIDVRRKTIKYFDSLGQDGHRICKSLCQYLLEESKTKRNIEISPSEWTLYCMKSHEIPQQLNGSDCGVFTCKYADYISRDKPITFTQHQMSYFRRKMVWEILHQQLL